MTETQAVNPALEAEQRRFAATRFRALIQQLGEEHGRQRGWKTKVADMLGIDKSYLSVLARRADTTIGISVLTGAAERLKISINYFFDTTREDPHYTEYTTGSTALVPSSQPGETRAAREPRSYDRVAMAVANNPTWPNMAELKSLADKYVDQSAQHPKLADPVILQMARAILESPIVAAARAVAEAQRHREDLKPYADRLVMTVYRAT